MSQISSQPRFTNQQQLDSATDQLGNQFFSSPSDTRVSFFSQENFCRGQKIKFIFFLSILKRVSSLKPAGEDENKAHVNKL